MQVSIPVLDSLAEAAKEFVQKVITPPLEEVGLLISDNVKLWRFKNQVNIVTKAEEYLKSKNIKTKKVSLKIMAPLLEGAAMEEEDSLQDKWAALLANTVSESSQITTNLFSHILSQLTKEDADFFDIIYNNCVTSQKTEMVTFSLMQYRAIHTDSLRKVITSTNSYIIIDNLIRLRLIKDISYQNNGTTDAQFVTLTDLGFQFMNACRTY